MSGDNAPIRVQFQIETNPAKRATVELERQVTDSTGRMDRDMRKVGAATTGIGDAARRSAQVAAVGMRAMSAAIGATTAAAAAGERQWLALGTVILSSFAAGGPVVGGIALVAAGIGYLVSQTSESEEAAKRARAAHESWLKAVEERGKAAASVLQKLGIERLAQAGGMSADEFELFQNSNRAAGAASWLRAQLMAEQGEVARFQRMQDEGVWVLDGERTVDGLRAAQSSVARLTEELRMAEDAALKAARAMDLLRAGSATDRALRAKDSELDHRFRLEGIRAAAATVQAPGDERSALEQILRYEEQLKILRADTTGLRQAEIRDLAVALLREREILEVTREKNAALRIRDEGRELRSLRDDLELRRARNDMEREWIRLQHQVRDWREAGRSEDFISEAVRLSTARIQVSAPDVAQNFLQGLAPSLSQGLTDIIVDGITTGFNNASDIGRSIMNTLLRSLINDIISSGITQLLSSLTSGFGGGGGGGLGLVGSIVGAFAGGGGGGGGVLPVGDVSVPLPAVGATGGTGGC